MIGQTLGHYRIVEKIGAGGMGVVYRARDEHLDREVAIKVLPAGTLADEAARKRFRREALSLAKLNHPNIAGIYDFDTQDGVDFLVMEHIPGVTLDERLAAGLLPEKEIARLGTQLGEGLATAHAQGVIHRDLKPSNLRVTLDGRLKILDFGLAKVLRPLGQAEVTASLTETPTAAGTLPYMAPENLRGVAGDHRSDLYACGVILYEMATGQRPFQEKLPTALVDDILHKPPPPPGRLKLDLSSGLEGIILKCLEKEPENRYQSAGELVVDLRRLGVPTSAPAARTAAPAPTLGRKVFLMLGLGVVALLALLVLAVGLNLGGWRERLLGGGGSSQIGSLAVLPLENFSQDPGQDYFVDGMTEALITELAQIEALRVISLTSVMAYKDHRKPLSQIARELNVDTVVEGSVLRSEGRVRITAKLIRISPEQHLWAKSYERDLRDVLALQAEVARTIAMEIRIKLTPKEESRLQSAPVVNPEAHDAYLRGRYYWNKGEADDLEKARQFFQLALEKDPRYAPAYVGLADYYSLLPFYTGASPDEVFPKAKEAIAKALALDDTLAEAHASLAYIRTYYDWDWAAANKEFQQALALTPNDAALRHRYSRYLSSLGRVEEALAEIRRAKELDPLSLIIKANVGVVYYFGRQYDQAIEQLKNVLREQPEFSTAHWGLGLAYEQKGMQAEALAEFEKAATLSQRGTNAVASLGHAYAVAGKKREAQAVLEELQERAKNGKVSAYQMALIYVGLGNNDRAFQALEKAFQERSTLLTYLPMDPRFESLRSDPRFQDLLRRMNFPE